MATKLHSLVAWCMYKFLFIFNICLFTHPMIFKKNQYLKFFLNYTSKIDRKLFKVSSRSK